MTRRIASHPQSGELIELILPVATTSGVDTITRAAQPALSKALGARSSSRISPPLAGIVGTQALLKAAPDGTTLDEVLTESLQGRIDAY